MVEKIKVTVNFTVYETLKRDMLEFGNRKPSGRVNVNEFLCNVAIKMYRQRVKERNMYEREFSNMFLSDDIIDDVVTTALQLKNYKHVQLFKVTDNNDSFIIYTNKTNIQEINEIIINGAGKQNVTASEYFRGLYTEYANKTKVARERVLFQDLIDRINYIASRQRIVSFDYKWMNVEVAPNCAFEDYSDNAVYMYAFETDTNNPVAFKVNQIKNLIEINVKQDVYSYAEFDDRRYCSGYIDSMDELIDIKFTLTTSGWLRYMDTKDIYRYNIELSFNSNDIDEEDEDSISEHKVTTTEQFFFDYFISYGKNINIISPLSLKERFNSFYKDSIE